jgi:nicotinic acid phosphoribosyltransferase
MTPILGSLLETDLYKFTMWQAMLHPQRVSAVAIARRVE